MENKRIISVLFSRYSNFQSNLVYLLGGRKFTHVSLCLDDDDLYFYTFNKKGFRREYPKKHLMLVESVLYKIEISEEEYIRIKRDIKEFDKLKDSYKYSLFGLFLCFLHIKNKFKKRYFCSQFMAEILENNIDNFYLEKDASLCLPNDIFKMVNKHLVVKKVINNHLFEKKEL